MSPYISYLGFPFFKNYMSRRCFFTGIHGLPMGLTMNALLHCRFPLTSGSTLLGIELGSTRIKAILTAPDGTPLASGSYTWETVWKTAFGPMRWRTYGKGFRDAMRP